MPPKNLGLGSEVLHRKAKMIKFKRKIVISCKQLTDRNKIFAENGNKENVAEKKEDKIQWE